MRLRPRLDPGTCARQQNACRHAWAAHRPSTARPGTLASLGRTSCRVSPTPSGVSSATATDWSPPWARVRPRTSTWLTTSRSIAGWPSRCSIRPWPATAPSSSASGPRPRRWPPSTTPTSCRSTTGARRRASRTWSSSSWPAAASARCTTPGSCSPRQQAVQIGIEASAGLDYAHRRGLVHRDIKPANLLFDADGRLRIADFGLARALAEASWTEPDGAILGTARYSAPEQVEGWVLDGKADVYALALVLYEGVTGEAPFIGDTTVATLMARVGVLLPEHEALGPLNDVLVWAAAPEPSERYDAAAAGRAARGAGRVPAPTRSAAHRGGARRRAGRGGADPGPTGPDRGSLDGPDLTELGVPDPAGETEEGHQEAPHGQGERVPAPAPSLAVGRRGRRGRRRPHRHGRRRGRPQRGVHPQPPGAVAGGQDAWPRPTRPCTTTTSRSTPTGQVYNITVPAGLILSQHPTPALEGQAGHRQAGLDHRRGASRRGKPPVTIPAVGLDRHLHPGHPGPQDRQPGRGVPTHRPAVQLDSGGRRGPGTSPAKTAQYGSTVTIIISKGHAPVVVPTVTGSTSTYATASATLTAAGFAPTESRDYSSTVPVGPGHQHHAGADGRTAAVRLPGDGGGLDRAPTGDRPQRGGQVGPGATAALEALGLQVAGPYGPPHSIKVLSTAPTAGTSVLPGTTVDLYTK